MGQRLQESPLFVGVGVPLDSHPSLFYRSRCKPLKVVTDLHPALASHRLLFPHETRRNGAILSLCVVSVTNTDSKWRER